MVEKKDFIQYLDMEDALKRLGGMKSIYISLLRKFLDNTSIEDLRKAERSGNRKEIDDASHAIKGLAANLSLPALSSAAAALNNAVRSGEAGGDLPQRVYDAWEKTAYVIRETI